MSRDSRGWCLQFPLPSTTFASIKTQTSLFCFSLRLLQLQLIGYWYAAPPPFHLGITLSHHMVDTMPSSSAQPLRRFISFPRLPPEIRLMIFSLAIEPRTVIIDSCYYPATRPTVGRYLSRTPQPALFFVCRESLAMKLNSAMRIYLSSKIVIARRRTLESGSFQSSRSTI